MGIELPAELAGIAERTGAQWPKADEDAMRAQATAWREAAGGLRSLASDADSSAGGALQGMTGTAGDAARKQWAGFVDPDSGPLTAGATGAEQAADRLDHAALQIADGEVEMVRQLVSAARNEETAQAAAEGGHPTALLGVPNLLGAASTNLASVTDSLVGSVADTARPLDPTEQVNPNPGSRGPHGGGSSLLSAATGLTDGLLDTGQAAVAPTTDTVADTVSGTADAAERHFVDEAPSDRAAEVSDRAAEVADRAAEVSDRAAEVSDRAAEVPNRAAEVPVDRIPDAARDVSPHASTPPSGLPVAGGIPATGSFAEALTPRSGVPLGGTSLAGFADSPLPPGGQQAPAPPLPPAAAAGPPAAGYGPAPFGGQPGAAPAGSAAPAGPPPAAAPPGSAAGAGAAGAQQPPQRPEARPQPPAPQQQQPPVQPEKPQPEKPQPEKPQAEKQPALGTPRQDRKSVVALFLVHMFPLGHLPVAANEPARQLPPPEAAADFAAALRFEPHDHPRSEVFDPSGPLAELLPDSAGLAEDHHALAPMLNLYDPLAGLNERDWDRRYLVKQDERSTEYAWPPGEVYPEGCYDDPEPVMLEPGTLVDRFGDPHGRVFAAAETPYHKRSLPPPALHASYRRYRVLRPLPMWRGAVVSWFGQPGGGERYRAVYPARDLLVMGFLADVTAELAAESTAESDAEPAPQKQGGTP